MELVAVNVMPFVKMNDPPITALPVALFATKSTVGDTSTTTSLLFANTWSDAVGTDAPPSHVEVLLHNPDAAAYLIAIYIVPFDATAAATFATVAVFFNRVPIAADPDKLLVGVVHAFCIVNEAEPVSLSTNTPCVTNPTGGMITTPVISLLAPYTLPDLTLDALGYVCGFLSVYNVRYCFVVSVLNVHDVDELGISWSPGEYTDGVPSTSINGPVACTIPVVVEIAGENWLAEIAPLTTAVPAARYIASADDAINDPETDINAGFPVIYTVPIVPAVDPYIFPIIYNDGRGAPPAASRKHAAPPPTKLPKI